MRLLARFLGFAWHYLIPHFATSYYVYGVTDTGNRVLVILDSPDDLEEDQRQYVFGARYLVVAGYPLFVRHFTCS